MNAALSAFQAKKPTRSVEKIVFTEPEVVQEATTWLAHSAAEKAAKAQADNHKAILLPKVRRHWLEKNQGRPSAVATVVIPAGNANLQVSFSGAWTPKGEATNLIPAEYVREEFEIEIDGDAIPAGSPFLEGLLKLAQATGCMDAIQVKAVRKPVKAFGDLRHTILTPDANEALEAAGLGTRVAFKAA